MSVFGIGVRLIAPIILLVSDCWMRVKVVLVELSIDCVDSGAKDSRMQRADSVVYWSDRDWQHHYRGALLTPVLETNSKIMMHGDTLVQTLRHHIINPVSPN
jgi:hypothetical protein